jgi:hypothetical protein
MRKRKKEKKKRQEDKKKKKSKRNHDKLFPTAKNRTGNLQSRVFGQLLNHDVFSTYMHHFVQDDPHPLKDVIQDIMTTFKFTAKEVHHRPYSPIKFNGIFMDY